jgi:hypothetical protein
MKIEVIGLDPPCDFCNKLLENVKEAVKRAGIEAAVEKKWVLAPEIRDQYGLLLSPALVIDGLVVAQGKVYQIDQIINLLQG